MPFPLMNVNPNAAERLRRMAGEYWRGMSNPADREAPITGLMRDLGGGGVLQRLKERYLTKPWERGSSTLGQVLTDVLAYGPTAPLAAVSPSMERELDVAGSVLGMGQPGVLAQARWRQAGVPKSLIESIRGRPKDLIQERDVVFHALRDPESLEGVLEAGVIKTGRRPPEGSWSPSVARSPVTPWVEQRPLTLVLEKDKLPKLYPMAELEWEKTATTLPESWQKSGWMLSNDPRLDEYKKLLNKSLWEARGSRDLVSGHKYRARAKELAKQAGGEERMFSRFDYESRPREGKDLPASAIREVWETPSELETSMPDIWFEALGSKYGREIPVKRFGSISAARSGRAQMGGTARERLERIAGPQGRLPGELHRAAGGSR